jgi:hypothetical protein
MPAPRSGREANGAKRPCRTSSRYPLGCTGENEVTPFDRSILLGCFNDLARHSSIFQKESLRMTFP